VLFGPHMEDFAEIAADLIAAGAARTVSGASELTAAVTAILADSAVAKKMGAVALAFVQAKRRGVLDGHLEVISTLLAANPDNEAQHEGDAAQH